MLSALDVSASALIAQRQRMNAIADNLANLNTTRDADGKPSPFQRRFVTFAAAESGNSTDAPAGVTYQVAVDTSTPPRRVFEPGHPDADANGMVQLPNVNIYEEMADMIVASRTYEANVAVFKNGRAMAMQALSIGKH